LREGTTCLWTIRPDDYPAPAVHAFYVFGDGHSITDQSRARLVSWMDRWLKYDGDAWGGWDGTSSAVPGI